MCTHWEKCILEEINSVENNPAQAIISHFLQDRDQAWASFFSFGHLPLVESLVETEN